MNPVIAKLPQAKWDLIEIADWLTQFSETRADQFLTAVERTSARLASMPGLGTLYLVDHPTLADMRVWPVKGFKKC
jgi:plasmid stabilization system protein ParE